MSAFVLSDQHITAILEFVAPDPRTGDRPGYYWSGSWHQFGDWPTILGQTLVDQNHRSVAFRYSHLGVSAESPPYTGAGRHRPRLTPVQAIVACDSYIYQSCESPDWEQTEAFAMVQAIREHAIRKLDEYQEATKKCWSIA